MLKKSKITRIELFNQLFAKTILKYKNGEFNLFDFNQNLWRVMDQIRLVKHLATSRNWFRGKITFCFPNEAIELKDTAILLKNKVFKHYSKNVIISDYENLFKENLKNVQLVVCLGKTKHVLHERFLREKIYNVSIISVEFGQSYTHQLPVTVDNINKVLWLMFFFSKIYFRYDNRLLYLYKNKENRFMFHDAFTRRAILKYDSEEEREKREERRKKEKSLLLRLKTLLKEKLPENISLTSDKLNQIYLKLVSLKLKKIFDKLNCRGLELEDLELIKKIVLRKGIKLLASKVVKVLDKRMSSFDKVLLLWEKKEREFLNLLLKYEKILEDRKVDKNKNKSRTIKVKKHETKKVT